MKRNEYLLKKIEKIDKFLDILNKFLYLCEELELL